MARRRGDRPGGGVSYGTLETEMLGFLEDEEEGTPQWADTLTAEQQREFALQTNPSTGFLWWVPPRVQTFSTS